MVRLAAAKCPTCGASLRIDPAFEFVLCRYCNTSSFVQTRTRPVSRQVREQQSPIIDVSGRSAGWVAGLVAMVVIGGLIAGAVVLVDIARRAGTAPASVPTTAPATHVEAPVVSAVPQALASAPMWGERAPRPAPPEPDSHGGGAPKISSTAAKSPRGRVTIGQLTVSGRLGPDVVRRVVDGNNARFRLCYEQGLARTATLTGSLDVRFVIGRDGSVSNVSRGRSDLSDSGVGQCVMSAFYGLKFPVPEGGIVTVVYPLRFHPG